MAARDIVPVPGMPFEETLASAGPDLLREMIKGFAQRMMDAEAGGLCGAGYGEVSADRVNSRNYSRNLATKVPRSAQPWVSTLVRTISGQPDAASVRAQHAQVLTALEAKFPAAAAHLDDAREDILAFTAFPREIWRQVWSNNPQERLNKEVRRRTDVAGIFPSRDAIIRLVGAVLTEQNDEWTEARRYMGPEILAACKKGRNTTETSENGVTAEAIGA